MKSDIVHRLRGWNCLDVHEILTEAADEIEQLRHSAIDRERACRAAEKASQRYGQWMPQIWLDLFLDAYRDGVKDDTQ